MVPRLVIMKKAFRGALFSVLQARRSRADHRGITTQGSGLQSWHAIERPGAPTQRGDNSTSDAGGGAILRPHFPRDCRHNESPIVLLLAKATDDPSALCITGSFRGSWA
jgi:hypothetical protein